jgi:hypothetical protein
LGEKLGAPTAWLLCELFRAGFEPFCGISIIQLFVRYSSNPDLMKGRFHPMKIANVCDYGMHKTRQHPRNGSKPARVSETVSDTVCAPSFSPYRPSFAICYLLSAIL